MPYLLITFQKGGYLGMKEWGMINKIKKELEAGKSISEISRELGIDRKTVRKYRDMTHEDIAKKKNQNKNCTLTAKPLFWLYPKNKMQ